MKLLVSDYDGTFNSDNKNLYINIAAINKFRKNGNKFVIATGRNFESIKKETDIYDIQYDYLICNNGLIIFDNQNNIINYSTLSGEDLNYLYQSLKNNCDVKNLKLYNFYSSTKNLKNILEIYAKFKSAEASKWYKKYLESVMPNILCYQDGKDLFISSNETKASAVCFIQEKEAIDKDNIYTIGDNKNDLEMLEKFYGYKMLFSYPNMWFKNIPVTREVHTLVKKISK